MKLPKKTLERKLFADYDYVVGVDEVGMGCLAGPVVVCAVAFEKKFFNKAHRKLHWLRDSKLLNFKQREVFAQELMKLKGKDLTYTLTTSQVVTIDKINIYQAARQAMKRAVSLLVNSKSEYRNPKQIQKSENLKNSNLDIVSDLMLRTSNLKTVVLVDGPHKISGLSEEITQIPMVGGDRKVFAIACASILAKVYRDKMMIGYAKRFPGYGFEKHKGYGTKLHRAQLASLGPCPIHRRSFAPVTALL